MSPSRSRNLRLLQFRRRPGREAAPTVQDQRKRQLRAAQIRLLYGNANTGIGVTIVATPVLAYFQWGVVQHQVVLGWLLYMLLVSVARFILTRRYWRISPSGTEISRWSVAFAVGAGMAAAGWGGAGILLYAEAQLMNQVFLVFVLGGMMLGGASLLAPRSEAFLAFLLPTGLLPAIRLLSERDEEHLAMGLLAAVFTVATLTTTWRFYRAIETSLNLKFENQDLVEDLQIAKNQTEVLNQQLERRVEARTAELSRSAERLRAEIKQREQMEEELLRARKLESLGVLAGGIAHDFNNFLAVIQGSIELAKIRLIPDSSVREILEQTSSACQRAVFLSSQLLTFAKGGAPIRRVVSVGKLISDAVLLARAGAAVSISVEIAEDLWSAEVDAGQIVQVLHNILLNAKQAMLEGGIIEVRAENVALRGDKELSAGGHVRISISDYGCGISPDILPRIFEPYFTTKRSGSGLGLATAYAIVAKHGGRMSVESKCGQGSVFIVDLPASQSSPALESPVDARLRSGTGRLLVMDDVETLRTLLVNVLTTLGYEAQSAREGAEAIALYEAAKASGRGFDAVLLDLTVSGGMGGVETASRLKELDPSAKLIASSGYSDAPVMSNFREYGFDDVLPKPWAIAELSEVFRRVLAADAERRTE
jgi:signal transduction histidine kinase/CheY-like chemotaxis protein